MEIQLTLGYKAIIDDEDWPVVSDRKWIAHRVSCGLVYAASKMKRADGKWRVVLMHRLLLGLTERSIVTDHIDGNGLNNRRSNIRACTHAENMRNTSLRSHSKSGVKGVRVEQGKWGAPRLRARVVFNGKVHRKWFRLDQMDAAAAWAAEMRVGLHGAFAFELGQGSEATSTPTSSL